MYADTLTAQGSRLKFARLCVEVDASKPLPEEIFLQPPSKGSDAHPPLLKILVSYQWKPKRCSECLVFGHSNLNCPLQVSVAQQTISDAQGQAAATSLAASGQIKDSSSSANVWRIAGKKGKSRLSLSQDGILPTPSGKTHSLGSASLVIKETFSGPVESPMQAMVDSLASSVKDISSSVGATSGLDPASVMIKAPMASPATILSTSAGPSTSTVMSKAPMASPATILSSSAGPSTSTKSPMASPAKILTTSAGPPTSYAQILTTGQDAGDSPSPDCSSKLASRVKSIDGTIQISRQPHTSLQPSQSSSDPLGSSKHGSLAGRSSDKSSPFAAGNQIEGVPSPDKSKERQETSLPSVAPSLIHRGLMQGQSSGSP